MVRSIAAFVFGRAVALPIAADLLLTFPRFSCGVLLIQFGWSKFPTPQWFIEDVGKLGFPAPAVFAWAAVLTEIFASALLALGLATRLVGSLIIVTMLVAAFVQKADAALWERLPSLFFLLNAYFAVVLGSGRFSLDELVRRRWLSTNRSRPTATGTVGA